MTALSPPQPSSDPPAVASACGRPNVPAATTTTGALESLAGPCLRTSRTPGIPPVRLGTASSLYQLLLLFILVLLLVLVLVVVVALVVAILSLVLVLVLVLVLLMILGLVTVVFLLQRLGILSLR